MPSKPAASATRAARAKSSTISSSWARVAPRTHPMAGRLNRGEGATVRCRERALPTRPAWPSWAATAAPWAWTASVRRRRSGTRSLVKTSVWGLTRPPLDTAQ